MNVTVSLGAVIAGGITAVIVYQAFVAGPREMRRLAEKKRLEALP